MTGEFEAGYLRTGTQEFSNEWNLGSKVTKIMGFQVTMGWQWIFFTVFAKILAYNMES